MAGHRLAQVAGRVLVLHEADVGDDAADQQDGRPGDLAHRALGAAGGDQRQQHADGDRQQADVEVEGEGADDQPDQPDEGELAVAVQGGDRFVGLLGASGRWSERLLVGAGPRRWSGRGRVAVRRSVTWPPETPHPRAGADGGPPGPPPGMSSPVSSVASPATVAATKSSSGVAGDDPISSLRPPKRKNTTMLSRMLMTIEEPQRNSGLPGRSLSATTVLVMTPKIGQREKPPAVAPLMMNRPISTGLIPYRRRSPCRSAR